MISGAAIVGFLGKLLDALQQLFLVYAGKKIKEAEYEQGRAENYKKQAQEWADLSSKSDADIAAQLRNESDRARARRATDKATQDD